MTVDFGFSMLEGPPHGQPNKWQEDLDALLPHLEGHFKSLWMTDHFFWPDKPTFEAWTVMTYMAAKWTQFDVGPMVLGQSYRNPALLALMAATLQTLSHGRFIMAIGAGWKENEYRAYDYEYPSAGVRIEQLEDTVEIMKRLWTEPGAVTYHGKQYKIVDAYCDPKPDPVPTLIVGGGGKKTMMVAAKHADWWNLPDANYDKYKERQTILLQHCEDIGRDPSSIRKTWFGRLGVAKTYDEAVAYSNGKWHKDNAFVGTPEQVIEGMRRFVEDLNVDYFMMDVLNITDPDVRGMVLEDVLPKVRG